MSKIVQTVKDQFFEIPTEGTEQFRVRIIMSGYDYSNAAVGHILAGTPHTIEIEHFNDGVCKGSMAIPVKFLYIIEDVIHDIETIKEDIERKAKVEKIRRQKELDIDVE